MLGPAGSFDGIAVDQPTPGGLTRWLRTSGGAWVGVVTLVIPMTDGSTMKLEGQLIPARALRLH